MFHSENRIAPQINYLVLVELATSNNILSSLYLGPDPLHSLSYQAGIADQSYREVRPCC